MRLIITLLTMCLASTASAAEWAFRDSDRILSFKEVEALTAGNTLVFYDDGQSKYAADGGYSYTYASGQSAYGTYAIAEDGVICIAYQNGFGRCDRYVENNDRIVLLTEDGLRFPVRPLDKK